ncbi:MAG: ATP-dependent helicase Lhr and Lhr-like helicase [Actinomycetota bacterium]
MDVLDRFSPPVREWFRTSFPEPTAAQTQGWPAIASGEHTLLLAPTGSGKTLAAFLWALDRLSAEHSAATSASGDPAQRAPGTRVVYISPLRALAVDVERNLRAPLQGMAMAADRLGTSITVPTVGIRTGDTPADERRVMRRHPPDIHITTPESLFLLLTSQARETLTGVTTVIIDEIHAMAATKRGAHLSLSIERLEELVVANGNPAPQRIGLSATQRPLDEIARFLGGRKNDAWRGVSIVDAGTRKPLEIEVIVPVEDMGRLGEVMDEPMSGPAAGPPARHSIWPSIHPRLLELIHEHRSTLIFVNARRMAERLASRLNELHDAEVEGRAPIEHPSNMVGALGTGDGELVKAHHGSLAREQRLLIEDDLKAGRLKALVATSSLELGIDMGAIDLVIQVESPGSVASGLQRVGRAGHNVGDASKGKVFPKHRGDLVEAAVVVQRMREGLVEETRYPRNAIDVLSQQIVAMCALDDWSVDDLAALVRRAAGFGELTDDALFAVLDMLDGRYPSTEFAELRPRIVWDRVANTLRGRSGAQRLAVTNAGTIPDRGLFGVFLPEGGRVGELDEEMVYESRPGDAFILGASTWRIEDITYDRVIVTPAPGQPGKMPYWHGDKPGRPYEIGRAVGELLRKVRTPDAVQWLIADYGLDEWAADNLVRYVEEQSEATGGLVPDDRTIVVERFRDEIGDWRVCIQSVFGARVHAPWAMAIERRLSNDLGIEVQTIWSDDGIVLRLPENDDAVPVDELSISPDDIEDLVVEALPDTSLFSSRFRENAGRALLLPRKRPGQRTALWQQRQKSADLLQVASQYPQFPLLLETTRECLRDVFDIGGLKELLTSIRSRKVKFVSVETQQASPFASSLLFGWIAAFMYEGDSPLAERRAAALALDRNLLAELLGAEELRELLDPNVLADLELELQCLVDGRRARDPDELHDLLRRLGDLSMSELDQRAQDREPARVEAWVEQLVRERRAIQVQIGGEPRVAAAEDAARLRDALGVPVPPGLPHAFLEVVERPLDELVARHARTHGPFLTADIVRRLGTTADRVTDSLVRLEAAGRVVRGEFRPDGTEREWCDDEVLRVLRRRSLAALRKEVEPVDAATLGRFLPGWHGIGEPNRGIDAVADAVAHLQGAVVHASVLESVVLPARVAGYSHSDLDLLCSSGEVVWTGAGDGRVALYSRDQVALLAPRVPDELPSEETHEALRAALAQRGALFWPDLVAAAGTADEKTVLGALWDLVWSGEVTNDTIAPLRSWLAGATSAAARRRGRRPPPGRLTRVGPPAGAGRWSLTAPLLEPAPTPTERSHARARALLERHGVVTREAVLAEGVEGGFTAVYGVLKAMEETGQVRRGYFVAGLGAAQFAVPGAVDRLRAERQPVGGPMHEDRAPIVHVLAATDPAQPYGAAISWPESGGRPARAAGAQVVLVDGEAAAYLERGGRTLLTFAKAADTDAWVDGLVALVKERRVSRLAIAKIDGEAAAASPTAALLRAHGFQEGYKALTLSAR